MHLLENIKEAFRSIKSNMLRTILNDDAKWRQLLRGLGQTFYHQTVTTAQIINYFNQQTGRDLTPIFDQYLRHASLPVLEMRVVQNQLLARWIANAPGFAMPVRVRTKGSEYQFITPTTRLQPVALPGATRDNVEVDTFNYYVGVLVE